MFSHPRSVEAAGRWIPVRILGGDDLDRAGAAVLDRFGVMGYPTLLAVTADGRLVDGNVLSGHRPDPDGFVRALEEAWQAAERLLSRRSGGRGGPGEAGGTR